jgi:deoxyribodipyrimidine photo-lyase
VKTALHWFRRDLRITDNPALTAAATAAREVIPVYLLSRWKNHHRWTGSHRQEFLCGSLESLAHNLSSIGSRLVIRRGDAVDELLHLARETGAGAIFFNRDPDPFGRAVEERLTREGRAAGLEIKACQDACLHERSEVLTGNNEPYRVFTPYAKAWTKLPKTPPTGRLRALSTRAGIPSLPLPSLGTWGLSASGEILAPGEKAARERLTTFLTRGLPGYGARRDFPAEPATSRLSQDLRHGLLSIREVYARCRKRAEELPASERSNAQKYLSELIWREFYMSILWHFPEVLEEEFNPKFRGMDWPGKPEHFSRWTAGETGFPIVDAAMRELNETGFMHNRARMIAAMFLTKDLHLDWRQGEGYFMQQLTDGEIASNNGGWQWSAGTGADAAPYFRIQNPWTQTRRYDPEGAYIKRWLPELRNVPADKFFAPPESGRLAAGYPAPMVNHAAAREKTLELFARQKETANT